MGSHVSGYSSEADVQLFPHYSFRKTGLCKVCGGGGGGGGYSRTVFL